MMINEIKGTNTKDKITIRKLMAKDSGERKWIYVDYSIPSLDDIALGVVKDNKLEKQSIKCLMNGGELLEMLH